MNELELAGTTVSIVDLSCELGRRLVEDPVELEAWRAKMTEVIAGEGFSPLLAESIANRIMVDMFGLPPLIHGFKVWSESVCTQPFWTMTREDKEWETVVVNNWHAWPAFELWTDEGDQPFVVGGESP